MLKFSVNIQVIYERGLVIVDTSAMETAAFIQMFHCNEQSFYFSSGVEKVRTICSFITILWNSLIDTLLIKIVTLTRNYRLVARKLRRDIIIEKLRIKVSCKKMLSSVILMTVPFNDTVLLD